MRKAKRYPVPEKLLHMPDNFQLNIDSIMHSAYNSDDGGLSGIDMCGCNVCLLGVKHDQIDE